MNGDALNDGAMVRWGSDHNNIILLADVVLLSGQASYQLKALGNNILTGINDEHMNVIGSCYVIIDLSGLVGRGFAGKARSYSAREIIGRMVGVPG